MSQEWKRGRAAKRAKPGNGRDLKPFRWWQLPGRALFHLRICDREGQLMVYSVDVPNKRFQGYDDGKPKAHLYLNRKHRAESKVPAFFPVHRGSIEVELSTFGIKRLHYVGADGQENQLEPDPKSAEGLRVRLGREHPMLSRVLGFTSVVFLVIGTLLLVLQIAEPVSSIPPIADSIGTFDSPVHLPLWLNIGLGLASLAASTDRALRLRFTWLDSTGN